MENNIYDMSKTCQIGTKFYEKIGKNKFRVMTTICEGNEIVKDKKMIDKLNKIFGPDVVIDD